MIWKVCIGVLSGAIAACVPMEQSALTYTSKTTMGVGLSSGTTETPGLDVTIGFKEANVALVPVAVAKYCYKATASQCQNAIYQMSLITGGKSDPNDSPDVLARLSEITGELESLIAERRSDTNRLAELNTKLKLAEDAEVAEADIERLSEDNTTSDVETANRVASLQAVANLRPSGFDASKARDEVAAIQKAEVGRKSRTEALQKEKSELLAQLDSSSTRKDSYSVYGKFSGSSSADAKGAGLTAGKIFATGVAAQNITEYSTTADCLANVAVLAAAMPVGQDAEKAELLSSATSVCSKHNRSAGN